MNQSHDSLKNDYEVTGFELDTLVYEGRKLPGVIGTRMTGAGFGGCTVSIVRKSESTKFMTELAAAYHSRTGLVPDFYQPEIGNGAGRLKILKLPAGSIVLLLKFLLSTSFTHRKPTVAHLSNPGETISKIWVLSRG